MVSGRVKLILLSASLLTMVVIVCRGALTKPPDSNQARPPIDPHGFISHTERVTVHVPMQFLHEWRRESSGHLENTLRGTSKIAGVARTELIHGTWPQVGARRRVIRKDGNQSLEEVVENTWPTSFRYEVWGFTDRERILTDYLVGQFEHREVPGGTEVKWTYSFHRKSLLAGPILSLVVHSRIPDFMRSALENMSQQAEQAYNQQSEQSDSKITPAR